MTSDSDGDAIPDTSDNCPSFYNVDQADRDGDGIGDVCDPTPATYDPNLTATPSTVDAANNLVNAAPPGGTLPPYSTPATGAMTTVAVSSTMGGGGGGTQAFPLAQVTVPVSTVSGLMPSVVLAQQPANSQSGSFKIVNDPTYTSNPTTQSATSFAGYDIQLSRANSLTTWSDPNAIPNNAGTDGNTIPGLAANVQLVAPLTTALTTAFTNKTLAMEFTDASSMTAAITRIPDCRSGHYTTDGRCAQVFPVNQYNPATGFSTPVAYRVSVWSKLVFGCLINTGNNISNCGGCGIKCSNANMATVTCTNGVCSGTCAAGFADCNGNKQSDGCEVHTAVDVNHCGTCTTVCSTNNISPACSGGVCSGTCATGFADCNNNKQTDGCEINTTSNASNCGACGTVCSANGMATVTCAGSSCNGTCAAGQSDCNGNKQIDGCEVNTSTNTNNCGACGTVCSSSGMASVTCAGGSCNGSCAGGFADCNGNKQSDGCEVNTTNNVSNCGGCGTVCSTNNISRVCSGSSCNAGTCNAGYLNCVGTKQANGCSTAYISDTNNCGGCGTVCSGNNMATVSCGNYTCNGTCASGFGDCNLNKQVDGCETALNTTSNCGGCGIVCSAGQTCTSGACVNGQATANQCSNGTDPFTGSAYTVCSANATTAWISANTGGTYHADYICKQLGYTGGMQSYGGTCGNVCGFCQGATSCNSLGTQTMNGGGLAGSDANGRLLSYTVNWTCFKADPCANYGGTVVTVNANIHVCNNAVAWGTWVPANIPSPWQVCTLSQWAAYAPSGTPQSYGLDTIWINGASCGAGQNREVYVSYPMNQVACYNGANCCWGNSTVLRFAVCSP